MTSDISLIEANKENITQLPSGRSFSGLVSTFQQSTTSSYKNDIELQRQQFESQIQDLDELDDPLQVFVDYINWTHEKYPQGNNNESGLLPLLEKCTSTLRDVKHYKNDPRYLKVWLEYVRYSDSPIDVFVYLAKKEIGRELALFFEQFAYHLEALQRYEDARSVYEIGIQLCAHPAIRLSKSLEQFQLRSADFTVDKSDTSVRSVLTLKRGTNTAPVEGSESFAKRPKLQIHVDESSHNLITEALFTRASESVKEIGMISHRRKENRISARPWSGETLVQASKQNKPTKISVYEDPVAGDFTQRVLQVEAERAFTVVTRPGKRPEKLDVNLELLVDEEDSDELSLPELLLKCRRRNQNVRSECPSVPIDVDEELPQEAQGTHNDSQQDNSESEQDSTIHVRTNDTFTIPLKSEDSNHILKNSPKSPTITFYSKAATNEVISMFNSASKNLDTDHEDDKSENSTNYDGFVTETIHRQPARHSYKLLEEVKTPPTQNSSAQSSPFVERPSSMFGEVNIFDPTAEELRSKLISTLNPPLETYHGYHELLNSSKQSIKKFQSITDNNTKLIVKGHIHSILRFNDDCIYSLISQLGVGGYGYVYLVESELGHLRALKVESNSSNWEFYILNQVHKRLKDDDEEISSRIILPKSLYLYNDESYLILNYVSQGTLLDVVNLYRAQGESVDEALCVFFAIELLKIVEKVHSIGIIHGDLKADNCMVSFESCDEWNENYSGTGENGWKCKKMILIDFGRAIDLTLLPEGAQFKSNWKTDQQDCPQMNNNEPWLFEADYYGIAAIIHTLLFGKYIEVDQLSSGKYRLTNTLKRYWQASMWDSLFDMLINPYYNCEDKFPLVDEMKNQRVRLQEWLEQNSHRRNLKMIISDLERQLQRPNARKL